MTRKHHPNSTFSLAGRSFFFWFDLGLILISSAILPISFFHLAGRGIIYILAVVSIIGLAPVCWSALKALINRRLTIDLLASIALIFSLLAHQWQSAVFIGLMLASARLFARYTANRASRAVASLMKLRPTKVHILVGGKSMETEIEKIKVGDLVVVESGERVAVDGTVESGEASIDQSSLTGESEPIRKAAGDEVFSSTLNVSGSLIVRARRVGKETTFSKILELVAKSQASKVPIASIVERFAGWYILFTLIGSVVLFILTKNTLLVLSVLLVTCADDLAVALPLTFTVAIGALARRGIIVKGGEFLEGFTKTKIMIFDKTGTITEGRPRIEEIATFNNYPQPDFLAILGAVESESNHPTARAVQDFVVAQNIETPPIVKVHEEPGFGIKGIINKQEVMAGKTKFLRDGGIIFSPSETEQIEEQKKKQRTVTVLSVNGQPVGFVAMFDTIRPAAALLMSQLKNIGVERLIMLTGDNEKIAADVAHHVNIPEFKANLLPQDKINFLRRVQSLKYKVAMVGDGVNDAAALAAADIGVAMGAIGTDAAIESADVVLMKDNLANISETMDLSRRTLKIVRQDLWIWGTVQAIGLLLVFLNVLGPGGAAAYNFLTDFIPLLNSLRLFQFHFKTAK